MRERRRSSRGRWMSSDVRPATRPIGESRPGSGPSRRRGRASSRPLEPSPYRSPWMTDPALSRPGLGRRRGSDAGAPAARLAMVGARDELLDGDRARREAVRERRRVRAPHRRREAHDHQGRRADGALAAANEGGGDARRVVPRAKRRRRALRARRRGARPHARTRASRPRGRPTRT